MTADTRELAAAFDLEKLTPEFYANPYPTYRSLRETEPVKRLPNGSYFLTRYDDLVAAYKNTKTFSSDKKKEFAPKYGASLLYEHHTTSLVFNDPPAHTRVRRLIMGALSPRAIAGMEPDLVRLVDRLLDALAAKGKVDLIDDFAAAIPIEVIGNLLDVPEDEREPLRDWSLAILGALEPVIMSVTVTPVPAGEKLTLPGPSVTAVYEATTFDAVTSSTTTLSSVTLLAWAAS